MASDVDLANAALAAGFNRAGQRLINGYTPAEIAIAVALAESGGATANPDQIVGALNRTLKPGSYPALANWPNGSPGGGPEISLGPWQINYIAHPTYNPMRLGTDVAYNATAAFAIAGGGTSFRAWSTYTNGRYRSYLARAKTALSQATGQAPSSPELGDPGAVQGGGGPAGVITAGPTSDYVTGITSALFKSWFGINPGDFALRFIEVVGGALILGTGVAMFVFVLASKTPGVKQGAKLVAKSNPVSATAFAVAERRSNKVKQAEQEHKRDTGYAEREARQATARDKINAAGHRTVSREGKKTTSHSGASRPRRDGSNARRSERARRMDSSTDYAF